MRSAALLSLLCAGTAVRAADARTARVYVQPIPSSPSPPPPSWPAPALLAEISYDPLALSPSIVLSYEAPELPDGAELVRVGVYDERSGRWTSGTTLAAVDNFAKGYSAHLVVAVDATPPAAAPDASSPPPPPAGSGDVVSVTCRGVAIDAGQTRDFGPQVVVLPQARGAQPVLNKPVVLSREGNKVDAEQEKTFLQK